MVDPGDAGELGLLAVQATTVLEQLPAFLKELSATLVRVERHVQNLDRTTGPAPPG